MAVVRVAQPLNVAFPGQNAPLTGTPNTQPVSPWWQFWRNLWLRTGGDTGVDSALLQSNVSNLEVLSAPAASANASSATPAADHARREPVQLPGARERLRADHGRHSECGGYVARRWSNVVRVPPRRAGACRSG